MPVEDDNAWYRLFGAGTETPDSPAEASALARLRSSMFGRSQMPSRVGHMPVLERIGGGGMGVVFAAYDPRLERRVAVKILHRKDPRAIQRALREARALARVTHPNVIQVHGVELIDDRLHLIMEYAPGGTLKGWIRKERTWRDIVEMFVEAAAGLNAVHEADLVHGDFKPDNVLLDAQGRPRVADFGLATLSEKSEPDPESEDDQHSEESPKTISGGGTPGYASPEHACGQPFDARADQFSFCAALYGALYNVLPFFPADLVLRDLSEMRPPADGAPRIPAQVHAAILRGLALDPSQRFPSITALRQALVHGMGARRRRGAWVLAGGVVAGIVAAAFALATSGRDCNAAPAAMRDRWDGARDDVHAAIVAATTGGDAVRAAANVQGAEAYVDSWSSAWDQTCSPHEDALETDSALRRECLLRHRQAFNGLVDALMLVVPADVIFVNSALAELPAPARCIDAVLPVVPPPAPQHAAAAHQARARLARTRAELSLFRFNAALSMSDNVLRQAEQIGDPVLLADALFVRATAEEHLGHNENAKAAYGEAVGKALGVGYSPVIVSASTRLAYLRGYVEGATGEGRLWLGIGTAADAVAPDDSPQRAHLLRVGSNLSFRDGDLDGATSQMNAAIEMHTRVRGPNHTEVAIALQNLATLETAAGRNEEAMEVLDRAWRIFEEGVGLGHPVAISTFTEKGQLLRRMGRPDEAITLLRESIERTEQDSGPNNGLLADPYGLLGALLVEAHKPREAIKACSRAIELRTSAGGTETKGLAFDHTNLASAMVLEDDLAGAAVHFRRAVAIGDAIGGTPDLGTIMTRQTFAELLERTQERGEALAQAALVGEELISAGDFYADVVLQTATRAAALERRNGEARRGLAAIDRALAHAAGKTVSPAQKVDALRERADALRATGDLEQASSAVGEILADEALPKLTKAAAQVVQGDTLRALGRDPQRVQELGVAAAHVFTTTSGAFLGFAERADALAKPSP